MFPASSKSFIVFVFYYNYCYSVCFQCETFFVYLCLRLRRRAAVSLRQTRFGENRPAASVRPRLPPEDLPVRHSALPEPRASRRPAGPAGGPGESDMVTNVLLPRLFMFLGS